METGRHGDLISTPLVVATDHGQSMVESSVKAATQAFSTTQQGDQSTFGGYQEAKISLTISPHISNDAYVRLEVELIVERFLPPTDTRPGVPPDKTSRKLVGSVTLRDGETVLVGGLVLDQDLGRQDGVPPLADAPFVGPLFRLREKSCDRSSIYIFLTPTIIDAFDVLEELSYDRKLEVQKLMGPIRLIDPHFRPIELDHRAIAIEGIESSGNLDLPRYVPVVPHKDISGNVQK
jgi:type II secretory pathway component GspD/PulD (secretin)